MHSREPADALTSAPTGSEIHSLAGEWEAACCQPGEAGGGLPDAERLDWIPARVPGTAAAALAAAGRWDPAHPTDLDAEDWWFRTRFDASPAAPGEEVWLRLDGIATVAEVYVNGELALESGSMFVPAGLDVGALLREGSNELAIRCRALGSMLGQRRKPRARWRTGLVDGRLRFFRTMLLGRAPGFAPGPAAVGPWRPVLIERRRHVVVERVDLRAAVAGEDGVVELTGSLRALAGTELSAAEIVLDGPSGAHRGELTLASGPDGVELSGSLTVPGAERWWPHTHGDPVLHSVALRLQGAAGSIEIDCGRVGFRQLAAGAQAAHEVEVDGLDLHVNGVRVFARGAVWTPDDPLGLAPDRERLRAALERVRDAGMNMLRVPGTSAYESADFHDLCDELGLLVWQDFMFANLDYPLGDEDFRALVEAEVAALLSEVGGRPSLAVLCGNSEVEQQAAMLGLDPALGRGELFGELLPAAIAARGVDAVYVPSAPCGGDLPFRPDRGIANYYGVGGYRRPLADARLAGVRFAAECLAFANVPDEAGVEAIAPGGGAGVVHHPRWKAGVPRDTGTGWDFDDVRDHYLQLLFGHDPGKLRRYDPERYLELSRAVSGEVMAAVFGEWRRGGSPCGGGLVLWLRDLMPGAGWGVVDHSGAPKVAYHHLRRALAPRAVWISDEGLSGIGVHVANDRAEPLSARLRLGLYRDFEQQVGEASVDLELAGHGSQSLDLESLLGRFADASWAYRFGPPAQDLIVASLESGDGEGAERISQAFHFPAGRPTGTESRERLGLEASAVQVAEDRALLRLSCPRFVYGVRVQADGALPDDDAFSLEPGVPREVGLILHAREASPATIAVTALNLRGRLVVPLGG